MAIRRDTEGLVEADGPSQEGRCVLVAVVTGEAGRRIQAWREQHDPEQARRLPPHATLCYWPPVGQAVLLERQVRHAFDRPIAVRLGGVREFDNADRTLYVEVLDADALDAARVRLYDGTHLSLPGRSDWSWHVTCVRYGRQRPPEKLAALRLAAADLRLDAPWTVDTVAYLELRSGVYRPLATWHVGSR